MTLRSRLAFIRITQFSVAAVLCLAPPARAQAPGTFTATATVKTQNGVTATAPVSVIVDRFSTDGDRDAVMAALKKGGTDGVHGLLLTRPPIGTVKVGDSVTSIKYVYERATADGRLITAVTGVPIAYIGAGAPGAPLKSGVYLGLVMLEVKPGAAGHGEVAPATKVRLNEQGTIVTSDYSGDTVMLTNVVRK